MLSYKGEENPLFEAIVACFESQKCMSEPSLELEAVPTFDRASDKLEEAVEHFVTHFAREENSVYRVSHLKPSSLCIVRPLKKIGEEEN